MTSLIYNHKNYIIADNAANLVVSSRTSGQPFMWSEPKSVKCLDGEKMR